MEPQRLAQLSGHRGQRPGSAGDDARVREEVGIGGGEGGVGEVGERTVQWVLVLGGGGDVDAVARAEVAGVLDEMEGEE